MNTLHQMKQLAEEAKAKADAATEGPWANLTYVIFSQAVKNSDCFDLEIAKTDLDSNDFPHSVCELNAEFIARSRTSVPALSQAVLDLVNEVKVLREALEFYASRKNQECIDDVSELHKDPEIGEFVYADDFSGEVGVKAEGDQWYGYFQGRRARQALEQSKQRVGE